MVFGEVKSNVRKDSEMKKVHYVNNYLLNPYHEVTVSLIGCGGTGSQVLTSLGRISYALRQLGHPGLYVTAYDGDIVTEANCGRQLFSTQEIGYNKAEVLVTKMNMFFGTLLLMLSMGELQINSIVLLVRLPLPNENVHMRWNLTMMI